MKNHTGQQWQLARTLVLVSAAFAVACIFFFRNVAIDDAYIGFRFSENLREGHGLRWNPGGERVEGMTSILWTAVLAVFYSGKEHTYVIAKVLGLLSLGIGFVAAFRAARLLCAGRIPALTAAALLLCPVFYFQAFNGLETGAAIAAAAWMLFFALRSSENDHRPTFRWFFLSWLVAAMIRPEMALYGALLAVFVWQGKGYKGGWPFLREGLLFFILPGAVYFAWRAAYFGRLFPLTFYAKKGQALLQPSGVLYVLVTLLVTGWWVVLAGLAAASKGMSSLVRRRLLLLVVPALAGIAFYATMRPVMGFVFRFTVPYFIPLILAGTCAHASAPCVGGCLPYLRRFCVAVGLAAFLSVLVPAWHWATVNSRALRLTHVELGRALKLTGHQGVLLALNDLGGPAYFSDWTAYEGVGICTPAASIEKLPPEALAQRFQPDLIIISGGSEHEVVFGNYRIVRRIPWLVYADEAKGLTQDVYMRDGCGFADELRRVLQAVPGMEKTARPWYLHLYRMLKGLFPSA